MKKDGRSGYLLRDSESVSENIRALLSSTHQVRSFIRQKKISLSQNLKVLEAAEKGDVYSLEVALTWGGIPYATKVTLNPDVLLLHIRFSYFVIGRYTRIGFCVRSAKQVALTVDGILFAQ